MKLEFHWMNCLWLILPLLIWNLILGPRITDPRINSDEFSPKWQLMAENGLRIIVFAMPLLIPLMLKTPLQKAGLAVYIIGTLIYFISWVPLILAPHSAWSNSLIGLLAPRITPFFAFLGIALIGPSWIYGLTTLLFIILHTWHGIQNFQHL